MLNYLAVIKSKGVLLILNKGVRQAIIMGNDVFPGERMGGHRLYDFSRKRLPGSDLSQGPGKIERRVLQKRGALKIIIVYIGK